MEKKFTRTNIYMLDRDLWNWAQYRAKIRRFKSMSEYLFDLIQTDKNSCKEMGIEMPQPFSEGAKTQRKAWLTPKAQREAALAALPEYQESKIDKPKGHRKAVTSRK